MKINLVCSLFVLDNELNSNIRKNDIKKIKVLVDKDEHKLPNVNFDDKTDIKELLRKHITTIIGSGDFHLEQVFTLGDAKYYGDQNIDIIYIAVANIESVKKLDDNFELLDFGVYSNSSVKFGEVSYNFKTREKINKNNIEYVHDIDVNDISLEKVLLELLIAFKYLRTRVDFSDIMFKFMGSVFTLEDVRSVYEIITEKTVDKSNFRKKIVKYCEKVDSIIDSKGHRPTQMYKFKPLTNDIWL